MKIFRLFPALLIFFAILHASLSWSQDGVVESMAIVPVEKEKKLSTTEVHKRYIEKFSPIIEDLADDFVEHLNHAVGAVSRL